MRKSPYIFLILLFVSGFSLAQKPVTSDTTSSDESGFYINGGNTKVRELNCYEFDELIFKMKNKLPAFAFDKIQFGVRYHVPFYKRNPIFGFSTNDEEIETEIYTKEEIERLKDKPYLTFKVIVGEHPEEKEYLLQSSRVLTNTYLKYTQFEENVGRTTLSNFVRVFLVNRKEEVFDADCNCTKTNIIYDTYDYPIDEIVLKLNNQVVDDELATDHYDQRVLLSKHPLKANPDCYLNNSQPELLLPLLEKEYKRGGFVAPSSFAKCNCDDSLLIKDHFTVKKERLKKVGLELRKTKIDRRANKHFIYEIYDQSGAKNGCSIEIKTLDFKRDYTYVKGVYSNNLKEGTWEFYTIRVADGKKQLWLQQKFVNGKLIDENKTPHSPFE